MTVSGIGGPKRTFVYHGCNFMLGQVFRGLRVFTMQSSTSLFVRTEHGFLGKLDGKGVNGSLVGQKVDARLIDYEIRGAGGSERLFLSFELLEPEPVQAQKPPIVAPPEQKPRIEINSDAELFGRGKTLSREILKYGLNEERKDQAGKWLKLALDAVEEFTAEVKIGWTKELFSEFGLYREIAEQYPKLRARMGLAPAALELPNITKVKNYEALPMRRPRRRIDVHTDASLRPEDTPFANSDLNLLNRELGEVHKRIQNSMVFTWLPGQVRDARKLWQWLHYLVGGGIEKFKEEYPDCAGWPQPLAEAYLKYLGEVYQQLKSALG